jgi:deoxyribose-phosphate aldolase
MMRDALGPDVLLKWTQPVRSLETMLLCIAEGVGRFNGDVRRIMASAQYSARLGPLTVPVPGEHH